MNSLAILLVVMLAVAGAAFLLQVLAGARGDWRVSGPQATPFLGGLSPATHAWQRYHVRYYPMALLFIAFEMEMMFMYPWAVVFVEEGGKAMVEMGMFLGILSIGIVYGWRERVFRWQ